ncbi:hypothetical protein VFPFJ_07647 [Purpureocillium lilacinum]|uniref:Uncharacterized protein n=1 Tax=Purpureocillium lilacinum TaxID=33203 RepID=A0A179H678_PURLI|nr:hypothetical protein VFPFJ_07647 [Purpureocillium lilacinum]OAQ85258.1 hypothetical protein VFPFJ_07647 [Purpureocillium lilacinum]
MKRLELDERRASGRRRGPDQMDMDRVLSWQMFLLRSATRAKRSMLSSVADGVEWRPWRLRLFANLACIRFWKQSSCKYGVRARMLLTARRCTCCVLSMEQRAGGS